MTRTRACAARGCRNTCWTRSRLCSTHYQRLARFGHESQRPIREATLRVYRREARRFLQANADHPATHAALTVIQRAPEHATSWARKAFQRLQWLAVEPHEVLERALTFYLLLQRDGRHFVSDGAFEGLMGRDINHSRPVGRNALGKRQFLPAPFNRAVGRYVVEHLSPFLANVLRWTKETEEAERKLHADMRVPFPVRARIDCASLTRWRARCKPMEAQVESEVQEGA